jgi:uncharacterized protein (TIGR00369 family)
VNQAANPALPLDPPSAGRLRLDAAALNAFMARAFPLAEPGSRGQVKAVSPGRLVAVLDGGERGLRPGGVISGPTMMGLADMAVYALVLAHIGEVPMAVTTSLNIHFLRPAKAGALTAEARLLRLGRRIATADVALWTEGPERVAAHAVVAYAIPEGVQ